MELNRRRWLVHKTRHKINEVQRLGSSKFEMRKSKHIKNNRAIQQDSIKRDFPVSKIILEVHTCWQEKFRQNVGRKKLTNITKTRN